MPTLPRRIHASSFYSCLLALYLLPHAHANEEFVVTQVQSFEGANGGRVSAVAVRDQRSHQSLDSVVCLVLVDTSASQSGAYQKRALEACKGLLDHSRPEDRLSFATVDVSFTSVDDGFIPATDPVHRESLHDLRDLTPLGSTDFLLALERAADMFPDATRHGVVVYVGDGPNIGAIDPDAFGTVLDRFRDARLSFSAIGIGPRINSTILAAAANATGGMLVMPADHESATLAGKRMADSTRKPISWLDRVAVTDPSNGESLPIVPRRPPPLRGDRDSIFLVGGDVRKATLQCAVHADDRDSAELKIFSTTLSSTDSMDENAYLAELYRNALGTQGLFLPTLGREGLELARQTIVSEASTLATLSLQANAVGDVEAASRLADAAVRRDPSSDQVALIKAVTAKASDRVSSSDDSTSSEEEPTPVDSGNGSFTTVNDLDESIASKRVRSQQLEREIAVRIRDARGLLATAPDQAREQLKDAQVLVQESPDLDAATQQRLVAQLESRIRESVLRSREMSERTLATERTAAIGRERERSTAELVRKEERIKQLVARYNALVEIGITRGFSQGETYPKRLSPDQAADFEHPVTELTEAERSIGDQLLAEAPELWAQYPVPMPARVMARSAGLAARNLDYMAENYRTRRDQERGFMDVLHLVDVAAIPLPDEPPIIYPSVQRWREMLKKREKYKNASPSPDSENEKAIEKALKTKTTDKFKFTENSFEQFKKAVEDAFLIRVLFDDAMTREFDIAEPVITGDFSGMNLRSALRRILNPKALTYSVVDDVLLITTLEQAQAELLTKVYPVGDLVVPIGSTSVNPFNLGGTSSQNQNNPLPGGGGGGGLGNLPVCWLAREVYGVHDHRWLLVRDWVLGDAPPLLRAMYIAHGPALADWIRLRPVAKSLVRSMMDRLIADRLAGTGDLRRSLDAPPLVAQMQVSASRARLATTAATTRDTSSGKPNAPSTSPEGNERTRAAQGLPEHVLSAKDLAEALRNYLQPSTEDSNPSALSPAVEADLETTELEGAAGSRPQAGAGDGKAIDPIVLRSRLNELRFSARDLGEQERFAEASVLLQVAITVGMAQPWMYDALAVALEASGRPTEEIDRVLLSIADFATSSSELLTLATMLARRGSDAQVVQICRQILMYEPLNRQAAIMAMDSAVRCQDHRSTVMACAGVLGIDWPAEQSHLPIRAARLGQAALTILEEKGKSDLVRDLRSRLDQATVRDFVVDVSWTGDADIDIAVEEPPGTICSRNEPRTIAGGVLLETTGDDRTASAVRRETYVASAAFSGNYTVQIRRVYGRPIADTILVELTHAKGTDREERIVKKLPLGAEVQYLQVSVPGGRRSVPVEEARLLGDIATHKGIGTLAINRQLRMLVDDDTQAAVSDSRDTMAYTTGGLDGSAGSAMSSSRSNASTGYQPIITTLPEGLNHRINSAVVSHDRKYVRVSVFPFFTGVGQITQFNFSGGGAQGTGGMGGGGMGGGGMGGGGMGGGGMQGGGMQGGGMQGGGMQGGGMQGGGPLCWVAREVYGPANPRWLLFRAWLLSADAPEWLRVVYRQHGEAFAAWIRDKPMIKAGVRTLMDAAIESAVPRATMPCPGLE